MSSRMLRLSSCWNLHGRPQCSFWMTRYSVSKLLSSTNDFSSPEGSCRHKMRCQGQRANLRRISKGALPTSSCLYPDGFRHISFTHCCVSFATLFDGECGHLSLRLVLLMYSQVWPVLQMVLPIKVAKSFRSTSSITICRGRLIWQNSFSGQD